MPLKATIFISFFSRFISRCLCTFASLFLALHVESKALAETAAARDIQSALEAEANNILSRQLEPRRFLAYVRMNATKKPTATNQSALPFSAVKIDSAQLRSLLNGGNDGPLMDTLSFTLTVLFDQDVPDDAIRVATTVLSERFSVDAKERKISFRKEKIYHRLATEEDGLADKKRKLESEQIKLDSERAKAEDEKNKALVEVERTKLEIAKKELEFKRSQDERLDEEKKQQFEHEKQLAEQEKKVEELKTKITAQEEQSRKRPPYLQLLSEFQLAIIGILVAIAASISLLLTGGSVRRGMSSMADGLKAIGPGISEALQAQVTAKSAARTAEKQAEAEAKAAAEAEENRGVIESEQDPNWKDGVPQFDDYIRLLRDKIMVLSQEKNFAMLQQFVELAEGEDTVPMAAAILLELDQTSAAQLLQDIPPYSIARLRAWMAAPGALTAAKSLRSRAIQEFYGRITMDEFTQSPLMQIKDIGWLTRMGSKEMAEFSLTLSNDHRAAFLACLSPQRVKRMIDEVAQSQDAKEKLLLALNGLDDVTPERVKEFIAAATTSTASRKTAGSKKSVVDAPRMLGSIMKDLNPEDQTKLYEMIKGKAGLVSQIRQYYVPFSAITRLRPEMALDALKGRSDVQVAKMLFSASSDIREFVMNIFPDVKKETIADELRVLDANIGLEPRNRKASDKLQSEVCKYLVKLAKEGLLKLEDETGLGKVTPMKQQDPIAEANDSFENDNQGNGNNNAA